MASSPVFSAIRWTDLKVKIKRSRFCNSGTACKLPFWNTPVQTLLPSWAAPPDCTMGIWILLPGICPPYWMQPKIS